MTSAGDNTQLKSVVLPNFLIVGAAHAGTTSLYFYLRQHPEIFMPTDPKNKEPMYFVSADAPIKDLDTYLQLFRGAQGKKAIGEASTAYLYCEESPARIKSVLGRIKIIIILRDPAKRAFSNYNWMIRQGWEDAATFEEGLRRESVRRDDPHFRDHCLANYLDDYLYFSTGLYFQQVKRYVETFGKERVRIYLFEEFVKNPQAVCHDIFDFLGVDSIFTPVISVYNEGRRPLSVTLQSWVQGVAMGRKTCHPLRLVPKAHRGMLLRQIKNVNAHWGKKLHISPIMYQQLSQRYLPDIKKLEELLGRDLSVWYGQSE